MIPGSNILNTALSVIARQQFQYVAYASRTLQSNGQWLTVYKSSVSCSGSAQPVPRELYEKNGLQFQCTYFNFFVSRSVIDISRDVAGDQFIFNCKTYEALSKTPWSGIDGWDQVLCVEVPSS